MTPYTMLYAKTSSLEIRPLTYTDYDAFLEGFKNQRHSQNKFDEGWFDTSFITKDWYINKLREREDLGSKDVSYMLNIFRLSDGKSVGYCDITTHMREDFQYARVGYSIHNQFWRQGYAKEAIKALVKLAFKDLNFHRLEAHINLDNPISKKVVQSAGFEFEGIRKQFIFENDRWVDHEIYYILNPNWFDKNYMR